MQVLNGRAQCDDRFVRVQTTPRIVEATELVARAVEAEDEARVAGAERA